MHIMPNLYYLPFGFPFPFGTLSDLAQGDAAVMTDSTSDSTSDPSSSKGTTG